jgi:adenosine deaminase CECR1
MGIASSLAKPETDRNVEEAGQEPQQALSQTVKTTRRRRRWADLIANPFRSRAPDTSIIEGDARNGGGYVVTKRRKQDTVDSPAIDTIQEVPEDDLRQLRGALEKSQPSGGAPFEINEELGAKLASYAQEKMKTYDSVRQQGSRYEGSLGFDFVCTESAKELEIEANKVLQHLKKNDIARFYEPAPKKRGYRGQEHPRFYGDHFLSNADLIEQTQLFALCRAMPKGAHLHIHFNANLLPSVLLGIAKDMERMFIWSNIALDRPEAYDLCRIQFSIMSEETVQEKGKGNPFAKNYKCGAVMQFQEFLKAYPGGQEAADQFLQNKLVFHEEEAHNLLQTQEGLVGIRSTVRA